MASFSKGGSLNTYKEVQTYSDYPDHICRPVIVQHSVGGYMVRAQRIVQVRGSYDVPLNGLGGEYNVHEEWDDDSPRKVNDFFNQFHKEASRPTHSTLLSPPKYREHRDFSGSPLRNKLEGLHLQDNRGSSPYKYKNDGYAHSMDSPKAGHVKDYEVNNTWDSPPKSRLTNEDWDSRRDHDDYGKPKFNGGYKTTSPPLSQATNDIGPAMKILGVGNKPLASHTYAPNSHFPASYSTPHIKESYPEPTKGMKPLFSPGYTQQSHSLTSNPTPQRKEGYPEAAHGTKPLFSSVHTQQPYSPTSNPIPQRKENYPETAYDAKPLFTSGYTPQSHSPTSNPTPQRKESYPETTHDTNPMFSPVSIQQSTANPTSQNNESHPKKKKGWTSLFSSSAKQQPHPPTSHSTPDMKQSYTDHEPQGFQPSFTPSSPQKERYSPQIKDHYPDKIQRNESFPSPNENTQEPRYGAIPPQRETIDSSEARKRYGNLKPVSPAQMKYSGTIDSREAVKRYNGAFVP